MEERIYLLEVIGITKKIQGIKALDSLTFQLEAGTVHALMDKNGVGKATFIKCLFGLYREDEGKILIKGKPCIFNDTEHALKSGVAMVRYESNQVSKSSVMENIWLGRSSKRVYDDTLKIFNELKIDIDPKEKFSNLSTAGRQMVGIAKAFSYNAKILLLDEPTSSLADNEIVQLFNVINLLKVKGCGIIHTSHVMNEILQICDVVSVMRDGRIVSTMPAGDYS